MKLFRIRGGVHPEEKKELSADKAIETIPMPGLLHIPLQQHVGVPAEPVVKRGDFVTKGQVLAVAAAPISAPVHAPTSGEILGISRHTAPHPSGLAVRTITILPDGRDRWGHLPPPRDPFASPPEAIAERVAWAGIVGMGGAVFPAAAKFDLRDRYKLDILLMNGAECEPYLTCDDRLMRERAAKVVDGIRIMAHTLGVEKTVLAIENNKPQALAAMRTAVAEFPDIRVASVPTRYPMGSEKHLILAVTGRETPAGKLPADVGVVVHNMATAFAVHQAVREGKPLISRIVTVSGGAVRTPMNLEVLIGTPVAELLDHCGGLTQKPDRLLMGGPMMGQPLPNSDVPVVKGCSGVLALTPAETRKHAPMPCIRCGGCVQVCPCGLVPNEMMARVRADDLDGAARIGLNDCLSCGSCGYVCPAHIPMVQFFNYGKGRLRTNEFEKRQQEVTRRLAEQRAQRLERQLAEKKTMLAKRKAEQEAQKEAAQTPEASADA